MTAVPLLNHNISDALGAGWCYFLGHSMLIFCDPVILVVIHVALTVLLLVALLKVLLFPLLGVLTRSEKSMGILYTVYGVATVMCGLILQVADAARGYKAGIVFADYIVLTYLCFFNRWFRNKLIGLYNRIQRD